MVKLGKKLPSFTNRLMNYKEVIEHYGNDYKLYKAVESKVYALSIDEIGILWYIYVRKGGCYLWHMQS